MSEGVRRFTGRIPGALGWCGLCALAVLVLAAAPKKPPVAATKTAAAAPAGRDTMVVRTFVRTLADPKWEGRGIGTAGIDSAADWIAKRLRLAGFQPGGDSGTFYQTFEITTGVVPEAPCELRAHGKTFAL